MPFLTTLTCNICNEILRRECVASMRNRVPSFLYITEWDESAVRQLVETVKILSKDEVAVTLKGGIEICQKIMY